jgi:hypothetical protein
MNVVGMATVHRTINLSEKFSKLSFKLWPDNPRETFTGFVFIPPGNKINFKQSDGL